jgi:hypothetical protein
MIIVAWDTAGFHVPVVLSKGTTFNNAYHTIEIVGNIKKLREVHGTKRTRKLIVHADNARSQTAKVSLKFLVSNEMVRAPHSSYSPNLASSDFYLFADMK